MEYLLHVFILVEIYAILALSLELVAGQAGLLSVSHAAFFGIGAYSSALVGSQLEWGFLGGLAVGCVVAGLVAVPVAVATKRVRDDFFAIGTFGLQVVLFNVFNNWTEVTRGPLGLPGVSGPVIIGIEISERLEFAGTYATFTAGVFLVVWLTSRSPWGRVLRGIREDESLTKTYGKSTLMAKTEVFGLSAALAAMAGSLYAHYISYVDPGAFDVLESILVLSMVIIGGLGNPLGAVVGATLLVTLPELLRFLGVESSIAANVRQIVYGFLLVACIALRPRGLLGKYSLSDQRRNKIGAGD